jgi:hypothetical protein
MAYYIPFNLSEFPLRTRIPVSIWNRSGLLLLAAGMRIESEAQRAQLMVHDPVLRRADSELWRTAYLSHLDRMLRENRNIGDIASAQLPTALPDRDRSEKVDPFHEVNELLAKTAKLLTLVDDQDFQHRASIISRRLVTLLQQQPFVAVLDLLWCLHSAPAMSGPILALLQAMAVVIGLQQASGDEDLSPGVAEVPLRSVLDMARADALAANAPAGSLNAGGTAAVALPDDPAQRALVAAARLWAARLVQDAFQQPLPLAEIERRLYRPTDQSQVPWFRSLHSVFGPHVPGICVELANTEVAVITRHPRTPETVRVLSFVAASGNPLNDPVSRDMEDPRYAIRHTVPARQIRVRTDPRKFLRI